ncbi:Flp pilus assembly protein, ATPase CpaE [Orrella dioscoreae]|uniref:Flp pilus assembly protein, ATPase CpaE n=2 Tax=root TaxID=1 RepID=A0A1C3K0I6_9BURK|nr:Flp pilus assembly protein, ATPase CpaE [Orrella dioscoreae]SOE50713.1 Flp pilus assembly protein, ATPase CpaE [Orrella dioscoreae]
MIMKPHLKEGVALQKSTMFLFCSKDSRVAAQLGEAVGELGLLTQELPAIDRLAPRLVELSPRLVFLDFTPDEDEPGKLLRSADLARMLARIAPQLPCIAVGSLAQAEGPVAALRAGVTDFIDPGSAPYEIRDVVQRVLGAGSRESSRQGGHRGIVLLGARPGVGTSTLAVHLAGLVQERLTLAANVARGGRMPRTPAETRLSDRVAMLDLGWPAGDCLLYLNVDSEFDFAEAVRNLRRLDPTLLGTALAHTTGGISVLGLPRDMDAMRSISLSDSLLLFERLRQHFGALITDAGGLSNPEFVAGLARTAQEVWVVTDQSVGALVSLASLLRELESQHVDPGCLQLVVNRYDERYGMTATQIAERFNLPLAGTLPDRTLQLMVCTNQGRLLHEDAERDAYVRAVQALGNRVLAEETSGSSGRGSWMATWLPGVHKRMNII